VQPDRPAALALQVRLASAPQVKQVLLVRLVQPTDLLVQLVIRVSALLVRPDPRAALVPRVRVYKARPVALQAPRVRPVPQAHPQVKLVPQVRLAVPLVRLVLRA
jgi:hypothetical protein